MQIVVLAGGLATRMRPDTEQIPKSLLMVNGRPFVDWQLDRFAASGARSVVMCVGYLGEAIETHVRRALDRGLMVAYSYDGEQLIGTGGALRRALARHVPDEGARDQARSLRGHVPQRAPALHAATGLGYEG